MLIRRQYALFAFGLCFGSAITGCQSQAGEPTLTDSERNSIAGEINRAVGQWISAAGTLSADSTFAVWSTSRDALIASDGVVLAPPAYRTVWQQTVSGLAKADYGNLETRVNVLSPNVAVSTSSSSAYWVTDAAGTRSPSAPYSLTAVWVREADGWKVVNAHQSYLGYLPTIGGRATP